jgi:hypothetical protein
MCMDASRKWIISSIVEVERCEDFASLTRRLVFRVVVSGERAVSGIEQEDLELRLFSWVTDAPLCTAWGHRAGVVLVGFEPGLLEL